MYLTDTRVAIDALELGFYRVYSHLLEADVLYLRAKEIPHLNSI